MAQHSSAERSDSRRGSLARLAIGLAVLVGAGAVTTLLIVNRPHPKMAPVSTRALTVRTLPTIEAPVARVWRGYGAARAMDAADVAAQVADVVTHRPPLIEAGRWVNAGDLLVQIDDAEFRDRLTEAEEAIAALQSQQESLEIEGASLARSVELAEEAIELSERELNRAREAQRQGAATQNEIDRLLRELTSLQRQTTDLRQRRDQVPIHRQELDARIRQQHAAARLAQRDIERAAVKAPIAGALQSVSVDQGDWIGVGQPVARIVDLRRIEAPMRMPLSAAAELQIGDEILLQNDGPTDQRWIGAVTRIAPEAEANARAIIVFTEVEQDARSATPETLRPGQFLIGEAQSRHAAPRLITPRHAVINDRVMIVNGEGRAESRPVVIDFYFDNVFPDLDPHITQWAAIREGLAPGERIIISNLDEISDGVIVEVAGATAGSGGVQ